MNNQQVKQNESTSPLERQRGVVIIDNYDSFTYNLSHLVKELGAEVTVYRNDQFEMQQLERFDKIILSPGPGIPSEAGLLMDVIKAYAGKKPILGVCLGHQAIGEFFGAKLENLSDVFHGVATEGNIQFTIHNSQFTGNNSQFTIHNSQFTIHNSQETIHNSQFTIHNSPLGDERRRFARRAEEFTDGERGVRDSIFEGLPERITMGRYHSWVVSKENFPDCLEITALSDEGQIMALRHKTLDIRGIQFHPESVLTPDGRTIIKNWLKG